MDNVGWCEGSGRSADILQDQSLPRRTAVKQEADEFQIQQSLGWAVGVEVFQVKKEEPDEEDSLFDSVSLSDRQGVTEQVLPPPCQMKDRFEEQDGESDGCSGVKEGAEDHCLENKDVEITEVLWGPVEASSSSETEDSESGTEHENLQDASVCLEEAIKDFRNLISTVTDFLTELTFPSISPSKACRNHGVSGCDSEDCSTPLSSDAVHFGGFAGVSSSVFPCTQCKLSYTIEHFLHRHMKRSHPEEYIALQHSGTIIAECSQTTKAKAQLHKSTETTHSTPTSPKSPAASAATTSALPRKRRSTRHACSQCGKTFSRKFDVKVHQRSHTGEKPYQCTDCEKSFVNSDGLKKHMRTHTGERPYTCSDCGKGFRAAHHLTRHKMTHTGEKPYDCNVCKKSFVTAVDLRNHQHPDLSRRFRCEQCEKSFSHRESLKAHVKTHTEEKPFPCSECDKCFRFSQDLKKHQVTHSGEKLYKCPQCEKSFSRKWCLTLHQRTHSGERPYHCSECGQSFSLIGHYKRHQQTHTGKRTFHCTQCGKSFFRAEHLKYHLRIHSETKMYTCSNCGKGFNQDSNLKRHQRSCVKPPKQNHNGS